MGGGLIVTIQIRFILPPSLLSNPLPVSFFLNLVYRTQYTLWGTMWHFIFCFLVVLGTEAQVFRVLGKHATTQLHP
jgi:hypothetical protein